MQPGSGGPGELGQPPALQRRRRRSRPTPTLCVSFVLCQVQQLQQVPVPHVYSSQVQYVEGGDASYTANAM